ncbi:hypothetical protein C7967_1155 [Thalassospira sp. 11-3]|nr:hypothetical protein C7967_1155 [Thalassospira sp. 11-3]
MDANTALAILKPLNLSQKDKRELCALLAGNRIKETKNKKVLTVAQAKADFKARLKNMVG